MSKVAEQPQQYKQPSRKGKKAWRKNVDLSEVNEGLRVVREEEIKGGVIAEKPSEELFTLDTTGDVEIEKVHRKQRKPLKADEILAQRSAIPAIDSRKRANPRVTDGVIEPKTKKQKSDWVSNKEWTRLKQVARENKPTAKQDGETLRDPWGDSVDVSKIQDPSFNFLPKPKSKVTPVTLKTAPISLAPQGGTSYNPSFEEWDSLLTAEGKKEVEAEKKRVEEAQKEAERQRLIAEGANDDGEVKSDDESAWEGFESEYEKPEWLNKKRPERKTQSQRNKIKRRKDAERKAKWEAKMRQKEEQALQIKSIAQLVDEQEAASKQMQSVSDSSDEGDDTVLRRRPLGGKNFAPEKPLEVVLPDELQDSLRLLKPEGNLLDDRFRTLIVQGKLESRKPVTQPKKAKRKATEKWAYKDFQIPASLKKDTSATRRKTESQPQNGLKRKRTDISIDKKVDRPRKFLKPRRMTEVVEGEEALSRRNSTSSNKAQLRDEHINEGLSESAEIGKYVAIDCEMVGVGPNPDKESALARVSIVNWNGDQVYDSFVKPKEKVTDWRTYVSGIAPKHMISARSFEEVQKDIAQILDGTVLVGHALRNDLEALILSHPKRDIRDTSKYPPYRKLAGGGSPSLKLLSAQLLGLKIQEGAHSSVEDARATMLLFRREKEGFDREHAKKWPVRVVPVIMEGDDAAKAKKKKKTKKSRKR
ncbi:hypothetical protein BGW36DRAFT_417384 [Talaromyces proteolyticus]|uniref:RNA exonuclease 4 n=1 Tax=Talaromyces proteolyticus TaxID=1131652 RepID=A0AAD4PZ68_9EURO|nr:uncharacterized protein BGW36DRAFT_417384 [Talaromyces proteolyticus]KAH8696097.1 hypothetical protein BGW36DRAFT_417384 [Talaromyces proteolyticus]